MTPILSVDGLTKTFGGVIAVDDVTIALEQTFSYWGIIGPNGSGKSTLLNCIAGIYEPDKGSIRLGDVDIGGAPPARISRHGLGRTFQHPRLFSHLTVLENLIAASNDAERVTRAAELLHMTGLQSAAFQYADELSGGQQKIIEVLRVLMLDPSLVLLDEFGAGVHPGVTEVLIDYLQAVGDRGARFLLVEHDMHVIEQLCDWVFVLDRGALVHQGPPDDVLDSQVLEDIYFRGADWKIK